MVNITFEGLLSGGPASYLTGISDLDIHWFGNTARLYAASGPSGGVTTVTLGPGGPQITDRDAFKPGTTPAVPIELELVDLGSGPALVALGRHETEPQSFGLSVSGEVKNSGSFSAAGGFPAPVVAMECYAAGGQDVVYASHWQTGGVAVYASNGGAPLAQVGSYGGGNPIKGADVVAIETVEAGGRSFLVTLSSTSNAVISYGLDDSGMPTRIMSLGAADGLGINAPTAMVSVEVAGETYVVIAASTSNSLSVVRVDRNGALVATDHVLDNLDTRFGSPQALEAVTIGDRQFLLAGGGDDGVAVLTVLPGGRLLHLGSIEDTLHAALQNVSALAATASNGKIEVFASSQAESGITHLTVDPGAVGQTKSGSAGGDTLNGTAAGDLLAGRGGNDRIDGRGGDDILMDGAGEDTLTGGAGRDIFVLTADGNRDTIADFELGHDRLDLSSFGLLYDLRQLTMKRTNDGMTIRFGSEDVRLISHNKAPIDPLKLELRDVIDLSHYLIEQKHLGGPIYGGKGDDNLKGTEGDDRIYGNGGNDLLRGRGGDDLLEGGAGFDELRGGPGRDELHGGAQADKLQGGTEDDDLLGGDGDDTLEGGDGDDFADGGSGNDKVSGENGDDRLEGGRGNDRLFGGAGDDRLVGGTQEDVLFGGADDDALLGHGGFDTLYGGSGDDVLHGGDHADKLYGDAGNDRLFGNAGQNTLHGGLGHDRLEGGEETDRLYGDAGDDRLFGRGGDDLLVGDAGHDMLAGGKGDDRLWAGDGNDTLYGEANSDSLKGEDGDDVLYGGTGFDKLDGGAGNDRLDGGDHADNLFGHTGNDVMYGGGGFDRLFGGDGDDIGRGGASTDTLLGQRGNDRLYGDAGDDRFWGGQGADWIEGGDGNDSLNGNAGFDVLIGGAGDDRLTGAFNADTFVFANGFGNDTIRDFDARNGEEKIDLAGVSAISSFADLTAHHLSQTGKHAVIDDGLGNTITVLNVTLAELDASDFLF